MTTLASVCAREIQTDELMREGVFAILGGDHVVMFKDNSMLLKASIDETTVYDVMQRHNYEPYAFPTVGAEKVFCAVNHCLSSGLFIGGLGKGFHILMFTGWESENGDQMVKHPRFLEVENVTKEVQAANEAVEIIDEDLEAAAAFMDKNSHTQEQ